MKKSCESNDEVVILKDSGERTSFKTGAVRDAQTGKGRCDLLPLDIVGHVINSFELLYIETFKETKDVSYLYSAIKEFCTASSIDVHTMMLEVSKHFESGAIKYGENNWKKGIDLHYYINSAVRHYLKHRRGDVDEPHDRAFVWNVLCAAWTITHKPELDDIQICEAAEEKTPNKIRAIYGLDPINGYNGH